MSDLLRHSEVKQVFVQWKITLFMQLFPRRAFQSYKRCQNLLWSAYVLNCYKEFKEKDSHLFKEHNKNKTKTFVWCNFDQIIA